MPPSHATTGAVMTSKPRTPALEPASTAPALEGAPALEDLLARFAPALRRVAATYESDPVLQQDLLQEIGVAVWRALDSFRGEASAKTFVLRVAHNRGLSHAWRQQRRRRHETPAADAVPEVADPQPSPESATLRRERRHRLRAAVRALPLALRQVVTLRLEGLNDREIAEVLGLSLSNVGVRLTRARRALRAVLGEESS